MIMGAILKVCSGIVKYNSNYYTKIKLYLFLLRVCLGDSCTLWASHSTPSAIPSLKDINNKGTQSTHDCKHYDNSAGIELTQVQIHTLWVVLSQATPMFSILHKYGSGLGMRLNIWTCTKFHTEIFFHYYRKVSVVAYPLSAEILCILQSLSPIDSTLVSKALSTSVSGRAS